MSGILIALELAGHVVLLMWGMRMVQSGVERAFGSDLRRILGQALRNRIVAVGAGAAVTMLLQSSTATAMMVTSFAARGTVALIPALAVMLGANVGTALIVKALSFDVSWLSPLLILAGYLVFKRSPKGRTRDLGRVGIGLGLMLLALQMMVTTLQPAGGAASGPVMTALTTDPVLRDLFASFTNDPIIDVLAGAVAALVAHSSVAVLLLLTSLAGSHAISPMAAIALVLGANVGGALPPMLETSALNPANRRVPAGNLLFRSVGCLVVLPFAAPVASLLWRLDPDPRAAVTTFHLAFNVLLAVAAVGVLGPVETLLHRVFPDKVKAAPEGPRPLFLDLTALETPYLALSNAAREILRMGDLVDALLALLPASLARREKATAEQASRLGRELDLLHDAVKGYLARLERADLTERDIIRLSDLLEFAVNMGQAGDLLERRIKQIASRRDDAASEPDRDAMLRIHARVSADLKLALATMMTEDQRSARELLDAKRGVNEAERNAARDHLARLGGGDAAALVGSTMFLATLRDLKQANSHLSSIGYAVLDSNEPDTSRPKADNDRTDG